MTIVERIAKAFHETYEAQADFYGWQSQTPVPWDEVPTANKALMMSVVDTLIAGNVIVPGSMIPADFQTGTGLCECDLICRHPDRCTRPEYDGSGNLIRPGRVSPDA